jgi:hypothetical protein
MKQEDVVVVQDKQVQKAVLHFRVYKASYALDLNRLSLSSTLLTTHHMKQILCILFPLSQISFQSQLIATLSYHIKE